MALAAWALAAAAQAASTLTVCTEAAPEGFDIVRYELSATNDAAGLPIYDQLLRFKPGSTELAPGIAERWEVSADGLGVTLHLRRGVRFHTTPWFTPTRELNADDVLFSLNRMFDKTHFAHAAAPNGYVYWAGMEMSKLLRGVTKMDTHTVHLTLARPAAPLLANLAIPPIGSVYPAEYAAQLARTGTLEALNTQPVGSGAFVFKSYQKDATVRYTANTAWWGGAPKVDNLVFAITPDPDVRAQRVKAGECLVGTDLQPQSAAALGAAPGLALVRNTPLATGYLALNVRRPGLGDARVRQALWLAIDKQTYIQSVTAGLATPAASFLPPGIWSHDKGLADRRDPDQARALLKAAGYDGREFVLFVATGSDRKRAAELLQADWAAVGVKSRVQVMELGALYKRTGAGEHDVALLSWYSDNGDPDNFLAPNLSCAADQAGGNKAHWCDPAFDALLAAAVKTTDMARRTTLYQQAQRLVWEQVPVIPLVYPTTLTSVSRRVQGYRNSPFDNHDFRAVGLN